MYLTTNGYYLDEPMAKKLAEYKVSRVSVSIDSMDEKIHDEIRGRKESWKRAIAALEHVKNAGMDPYLNITVGHYNANTDHFKQLLDYSKQKGTKHYSMLLFHQECGKTLKTLYVMIKIENIYVK